MIDAADVSTEDGKGEKINHLGSHFVIHINNKYISSRSLIRTNHGLLDKHSLIFESVNISINLINFTFIHV